jgi:hypothetical protein
MNTRLVPTGIRLVPSTGNDDWYTGTAPLKGAYQYRSFPLVPEGGESAARRAHACAPGRPCVSCTAATFGLLTQRSARNSTATSAFATRFPGSISAKNTQFCSRCATECATALEVA